MDITKLWEALILMKDDRSASDTERENARRILQRFDKTKIYASKAKIADELLKLPEANIRILNQIKTVMTLKSQDLPVVFYEKQNEFHVYGDPQAVIVMKTFSDYAVSLCISGADSKNVAVYEQVFDMLVLDDNSKAVIMNDKKHLYKSLQNQFDVIPKYVSTIRTGKRDRNFANKQIERKPFNFTFQEK